jgi:predicted metalloprotease with PDZ domain
MEHLSPQHSIAPAILDQIAHEEFHSWNPYRIGHMPDPQEPVTWFSEGFTRYYETLMLFDAGLLPFPDYVAGFNAKLRSYELSEGRDVPLAEFVRRHVADKSALAGLEYQRGAVIAAWLDATIRHDSDGQFSLNDLMFYLARQDSDYQHKHDRSLIVSNKRIFKAASKYIRRASARRLRQYVERGGRIQVPEDALGTCAQSHTETIGRFDLGFDRSSISSESRKVVGVRPDSEAYKAGLRDGQQLLGWSITNNEPAKQVKLAIKTETGRREITYYPQGEKRPVQQFILDQDKYSLKPEACLLMFSRAAVQK